ncbi:MAG: HesB/IscA family protein [Alphaproteobacteria bacterium]
MNSPIQITEKAATQIQGLLDKSPNGTQGVRLTIKSTGCSGHSYQMEYVNAGDDLSKDEAFKENGSMIYIPKIYSWMLFGTEIDYITDDLGNSRFDFINPNETGRCGCGESFHVGGGLPSKS